MKYTANIQAGDVTITVKQVTRAIAAIDSGHPILAPLVVETFIL
jgi:hypothetical protein